MRKRISASDWVRAAVGSSKMMTLQFVKIYFTYRIIILYIK